MSKTRKTSVVATELEAVTLGVVWKNGPCTAYSIRQHFLQSPSPRWSGSAGAIYPLIRRLEQKRYVDSVANTRGRRKQRDYQLTQAGRTTFRRWLRQSTSDSGTELLHDPLRTRIFFLDALSNAQARSFVESALNAIRDRISSLQQDCDQHSVEENRTGFFAARNALLISQARIRWMEEVLQELESS